ncbi:MAG: 50S ribosomal protein L29 [Bacteroidetes bacterium RIFCSPLOWO2_12_FULL_35_15]|nr:MAG: 50S ribosomal protein L29 [Bacteroidetes bacterium RIFCSPLOWO2_12_FULL_35_15]
MKQADIKQLSTSDLRERIKEGKSALTKLKLNHAVSPIENPAKITDSRKTVARLQTELRSRELAEIKK